MTRKTLAFVWIRLLSVKQKVIQYYRKHFLAKMKPFPRRSGVMFIGYVEAGLGLAESLRGMISAVADRQIEYAIYPYSVGVESRITGQFMPERYDRKHRYDINIIEVAVDQVRSVFGSVDPRLAIGSYNILRTYWELAKAPQEWTPMLSRIDEIWVPNQFVRNAFREVFSGPITIIPPCVISNGGDYPERKYFELDLARFYFLFSFDYYSSPYRKNPLGVLDAFLRAFPNRSENVGLIIKSTGAEMHHPDIKNKIKLAVEADPRIKIIDKTMSRHEMLGLIKACDCYVSLHRAEGFGLGMAEAMSFGNIVIGTDYSGSMDFLSEKTGFPVAYSLRPLNLTEYAWAEGQLWAEPDLDSAVEAFRCVFHDVHSRERRAAAGKMLVELKYSKALVGAEVEKRLNEIKYSREQSNL